VERGWLLGEPAKYDRKLALYTEDCLAFVKNTQPKAWEKYQKLYPNDPEKAFITRVATQLNKVDPHASNKDLRKYGTLGALRHEVRDKSASFKLCQFKPEHGPQSRNPGHVRGQPPARSAGAGVQPVRQRSLHHCNPCEGLGRAATQSKNLAHRPRVFLERRPHRHAGTEERVQTRPSSAPFTNTRRRACPKIRPPTSRSRCFRSGAARSFISP
jgi:hypothetical protein